MNRKIEELEKQILSCKEEINKEIEKENKALFSELSKIGFTEVPDMTRSFSKPIDSKHSFSIVMGTKCIFLSVRHENVNLIGSKLYFYSVEELLKNIDEEMAKWKITPVKISGEINIPVRESKFDIADLYFYEDYFKVEVGQHE